MSRTNVRKEKIEFVRCNLCGADNSDNYILFEEYKYVKCRECGLIYQNPRPMFNALKNRYSKKYFNYEFRNQENFFNLMKLALKDLKFHEKIAPQFKVNNRKFLDIGSATGLLLNYIRQYGWEVTGVEICKESAEYAKKNFKLNIINKTVEEAGFRKESFDIVHMSHVIEHVPSPFDTLKEINRILKKDGYLIITTPRVDSFQAGLFKETWRSYHRDHIYIFSKNTLKNMLIKSGFKIKKFITWGGIEKGRANPFVKRIVDKLAKKFKFGDVMCFLAQK